MRCSFHNNHWTTTTACGSSARGAAAEGVLRHTVEQIIETFVPVHILDDPVPLRVEQLMDILKIIDMSSSVVQVIDVPKIISQDSIPQRTLLSELQQLVEQLVSP